MASNAKKDKRKPKRKSLSLDEMGGLIKTITGCLVAIGILSILEERVCGKKPEFKKAILEVERAEEAAARDTSRPSPKRAFVVMPLADEFNDVYVVGIREVAEQLGMIVERADDIEHNGSIPDRIKDSIAACDIVIAETSLPNPNVFYEVGLAHGIEKETILVCRNAETIPFDLAAVNHVVYKSIVELRERLKARLGTVLGIDVA